MENGKNIGFFPVLISLQNFPCLVVGGGKISERKVISLLDFNADITVISPKISRHLEDLSKKRRIKLIKKVYSGEFIKGFKIVFCATDNSNINKTVHDDCVKEGILINVADDPALCDFILPANIKRGDLTISISSQGKAPFFTGYMKRKLESLIPPVYKDIMDLAGDFRKLLLSKISGANGKASKIKSAKKKTKMFKEFTSKDWENILTENGGKNSEYYFKKILKESNQF